MEKHRDTENAGKLVARAKRAPELCPQLRDTATHQREALSLCGSILFFSAAPRLRANHLWRRIEHVAGKPRIAGMPIAYRVCVDFHSHQA